MMHRVLLLVTIASLLSTQICASSKTSAKASKSAAPASPSPLASHGMLKPKSNTNTKLAENDPKLPLISRQGKLTPMSQCPLASVFGLKTTATVRLVKDGEFSVCHNLSQTCCRASSLKNLNSRWNKHIASQRKMVWSYTRIGRLMLRVINNLDKKATACIKTDKKLKNKLAPARKLSVRLATTQEQHAKRVASSIIIPNGAKSPKASKKRLNCGADAQKLRDATKALKLVHKEYESQIQTCRKVIDDIRSKLICASCDPNSNGAIHGFEKKVEVSEEDFNEINKACSKPYWVMWRRQRPWIKAAFGYVKAITGKKLKKAAHDAEHLDRFNNEDCFKYGKVKNGAKKDVKLLGAKLVKDFRDEPKDQKKKNNRMLFSLGTHDKKKSPEHHYTHHCMRGIQFMSRKVFELKDSKRMSAKKYKVFKLIFNTLGNRKIRESFKRIVPKSVMPLTKKQKAAIRAKKAKASKAKAAAAKKSRSLKKLPAKKSKIAKQVKVIKGKKTATPVKKTGNTFKRLPIKKIKARFNPITKDKLRTWELMHSDPASYNKRKIVELRLKDYKDTGLKSLDVKKGKEQLVDRLTE